jgi:hypothetical protein
MVFASRDRSASFRRWVPQNLCVRATGVGGGRIARGDRFCCGGVPARRGVLERLGADREPLESGGGDHAAMVSVVISAHKNPASLRAIAVATTERTFLRAASLWNRTTVALARPRRVR